MYKQEQKKIINTPTNLFSLLNESDEEEEENKKKEITISKTKPINTNHQNIISNNIEDEMFKQYYGRKSYKNNDKRAIKNSNEDDFKDRFKDGFKDGFKSVSKKKDIIECKYKTITPNILDLNMSNYYKILVHHNDDLNWDFGSYYNVCTISKWNDIPKLFNSFSNITGANKFVDFDTFIMKNEILPLWEDVENRNGSICSIKVDSLKTGIELLKILLVYTANNTLLNFSPESWDKINGLSFSPKKMDNIENDFSYCVIIKIWFKENYGNNANIDKFFNKDILNYLNKYSIKVKSIKPEY
jgi:hypothetical protein